MTNQLVPIEINNQRILTTQQLAAVYGASEQQVQQILIIIRTILSRAGIIIF